MLFLSKIEGYVRSPPPLLLFFLPLLAEETKAKVFVTEY